MSEFQQTLDLLVVAQPGWPDPWAVDPFAGENGDDVGLGRVAAGAAFDREALLEKRCEVGRVTPRSRPRSCLPRLTAGTCSRLS